MNSFVVIVRLPQYGGRLESKKKKIVNVDINNSLKNSRLCY